MDGCSKKSKITIVAIPLFTFAFNLRVKIATINQKMDDIEPATIGIIIISDSFEYAKLIPNIPSSAMQSIDTN